MTVRRRKTTVDLPWFQLPLPGPAFYVGATIWRIALYCAFKNKLLLITGPTGCGKTQLVWLISETLKRALYPINMGATTDSRLALVGTTHFDGNHTRFLESEFIRGIEDPGGLILLDEITRASLDAFNLIMTVLDHQGYINVAEANPPRVAQKHSNAVIMATANVGDEYTGTRMIDRALKDRCLILELSYPPQEAEVMVLLKRTGCARGDAVNLVNFAHECRSLWHRDELSTPVSTRMLIEAAELVASGFSLLEALEPTVFNFYDDSDGAQSERVRVRQVLHRF